jgi:hypothetical protein
MHDSLNTTEPSQTNVLIRELLDSEICIVGGGMELGGEHAGYI